MTDEHKDIPLESIVWPDPTDITPGQIHDMACSFLVNGQVEPIVVASADKKGIYRGVVGRLRYEAMKYRWKSDPDGKTILARIHPFKDEIELKSWQLIENVHRREVTAMLKAKQYRELYDILRKESGEEATIQTLVDAIEASTGNKESRQTVQHYLTLTGLEPETQEVLTREQLSLRHGLELARVKDPKAQVKIAKEVAHKGMDVSNLKWRVDSLTEDERKSKHLARLKAKAKDLNEKGTKAWVEESLSWNVRQEKFREFYGEIPKRCQDCIKRGVLLAGNFQQKPICTDPACYEKDAKARQKEQEKAEAERKQKFNVERAKIYSMKPDVRHWRLAIYSLVDSNDIGRILGLKGQGYYWKSKALWTAIQQLDEETCQRILLQAALEDILSEPGSFDQDGGDVKKWTIEEFGLTPAVFLSKEDQEDAETQE